MLVLYVAFFALGLLGHVAFWVTVINRIHAWAVPRWLVESVTLMSFLLLGGIPLLMTVEYFSGPWTEQPYAGLGSLSLAYLAAGCIAAGVHGAVRLSYRLRDGRCSALLSNHTAAVDVAETLGGELASWGMPAVLARLPRNELFQVQVHHKQLAVERLPERLEGLRIAHVSDLHMSGRIRRPFFEEVVRLTNELAADLIAITGDLFDKHRCLEWIDATYARLSAPHGVYFVFGNHDVRVDTRQAARLLEEAGLVHLGGRWVSRSIHGAPVIIAGNELPWFPPAADLSDAPQTIESQRPFRLLLSHSPDQFAWAQANDVDLLLAGHNHGGQIRLPLLGAVFAPSSYGTRYAMGAFQQGNTVMHVSRGTGTHSPVRYNCPPEIALLELRCRGRA